MFSTLERARFALDFGARAGGGLPKGEGILYFRPQKIL